MVDAPTNRPRTVDVDRDGLTRRETLRYGGTGVAALGLAPGSAFLPDPTPRLEHAWMRVDEDASVEFVATFESSVDAAFRLPGVSKEKVAKMASEGELSVDLGATGYEPAPGVPEKRTLSGRVTGLVSRSSGSAGTTYSIDATGVDAAAVDEKFPVVNPVSDVKPQGPGQFLTIEYPDGYEYTLPPDTLVKTAVGGYRRSNFLADSEGGKPTVPFDGTPISYTDGEYESLPSITHRSDSDLAWQAAVADLKYEMLALPGSSHTLRDLYRPTWYGDQAVQKAFEVARHVGNRLGEAAIEQALTYKAPTAVTAPMDAADVASALHPDWAVPPADVESGDDGSGGLLDTIVGFFSGGDSEPTPEVPEEFQQAADVPLNSPWLIEVVDPDRSFPAVGAAGLESLYATTVFERAWNHLYATTGDEAALDQVELLYVQTLEAQRDVARQTAANVRQAPSQPDEGYWRDLYDHSLSLCSSVGDLASAQLDALEG